MKFHQTDAFTEIKKLYHYLVKQSIKILCSIDHDEIEQIEKNVSEREMLIKLISHKKKCFEKDYSNYKKIRELDLVSKIMIRKISEIDHKIEDRIEENLKEIASERVKLNKNKVKIKKFSPTAINKT